MMQRSKAGAAVTAAATFALGIMGCGKNESPTTITPGDFNMRRAEFIDKDVTIEGTAKIDHTPVVLQRNGRTETWNTLRVSSVSPLEGDGLDLLLFQHVGSDPVAPDLKLQPVAGVVRVSGHVAEMPGGRLTLDGLRVRGTE